MALPSLVVFDLDYTLWPFWIDTHVDPPFHKERGRVYDRRNEEIHHYPDVPDIFQRLQNLQIPIAFASRTTCTEDAKNLCRMFGWDQIATYSEIYPGCKVPHFNSFHQQSNIPYEKMLFFDDEYRNIQDISRLGVTCIHAKNGMSMNVFDVGLEKFARNQQKRR